MKENKTLQLLLFIIITLNLVFNVTLVYGADVTGEVTTGTNGDVVCPSIFTDSWITQHVSLVSSSLTSCTYRCVANGISNLNSNTITKTIESNKISISAWDIVNKCCPSGSTCIKTISGSEQCTLDSAGCLNTVGSGDAECTVGLVNSDGSTIQKYFSPPSGKDCTYWRNVCPDGYTKKETNKPNYPCCNNDIIVDGTCCYVGNGKKIIDGKCCSADTFSIGNDGRCCTSEEVGNSRNSYCNPNYVPVVSKSCTCSPDVVYYGDSYSCTLAIYQDGQNIDTIQKTGNVDNYGNFDFSTLFSSDKLSGASPYCSIKVEPKPVDSISPASCTCEPTSELKTGDSYACNYYSSDGTEISSMKLTGVISETVSAGDFLVAKSGSVECKLKIKELPLTCGTCNPSSIAYNYNNELKCSTIKSDGNSGDSITFSNDEVSAISKTAGKQDLTKNGITCEVTVAEEIKPTGGSCNPDGYNGECPSYCRSWEDPDCDYGRTGLVTINFGLSVFGLPPVNQMWNEWLSTIGISAFYDVMDNIPLSTSWFEKKICEEGNLFDDALTPTDYAGDLDANWVPPTDFLETDNGLTFAAEFDGRNYKISWMFSNFNENGSTFRFALVNQNGVSSFEENEVYPNYNEGNDAMTLNSGKYWSKLKNGAGNYVGKNIYQKYDTICLYVKARPLDGIYTVNDVNNDQDVFDFADKKMCRRIVEI